MIRSGNSAKGEKRRGYRGGRLPSGFSKVTPQMIIELAMTGSDEGDALASLGLKPYQVEKAKKNSKWRTTWDKARAEWVVKKNKEISESSDVRMLSLLAPKTMPENDLGEKVVFTVDAPEWFVKKIEKNAQVSR